MSMQTIEKAIDLNKESEKSLRSHKFIDYADAVALGNEALKRIKACREPEGGSPLPPLAGESSFIDTTRSTHSIKKVLGSPLGKDPKG